MLPRLCIALALVIPAAASTIAIGGDCSANCSLALTDQFGDAWGTVAAQVGDGSSFSVGTIPSPYPILDTVAGNITTSLGSTSAIQYVHPGASGPEPALHFTVTMDIPDTISLIDVYVYEQAWTDECHQCAPSFLVYGLDDAASVSSQDQYWVYSDIPNPGNITVIGDASTVIQDSTDSLSFLVAYSDPPSDAPEPEWLGILGLVLIAALARYRF